MTDESPDRYIWEGFYIHDQYDQPSGSVYATNREHAQTLIENEAGVESGDWQESTHAPNALYQRHDTEYHIITVARRPVYGDSE